MYTLFIKQHIKNTIRLKYKNGIQRKIFRDNPRMGPIHLARKLKRTLFLAGPHIQAIQISCQCCSNVDIKDSWAHQILQRAHKNFELPIKIWKFAGI